MRDLVAVFALRRIASCRGDHDHRTRRRSLARRGLRNVDRALAAVFLRIGRAPHESTVVVFDTADGCLHQPLSVADDRAGTTTDGPPSATSRCSRLADLNKGDNVVTVGKRRSPSSLQANFNDIDTNRDGRHNVGRASAIYRGHAFGDRRRRCIAGRRCFAGGLPPLVTQCRRHGKPRQSSPPAYLPLVLAAFRL